MLSNFHIQDNLLNLEFLNIQHNLLNSHSLHIPLNLPRLDFPLNNTIFFKADKIHPSIKNKLSNYEEPPKYENIYKESYSIEPLLPSYEDTIQKPSAPSYEEISEKS